MAGCLLLTGFSFWIEAGVEVSESRLAGVATGIFLFMAVYSPGEGPVPFTYSAEAFPIYIRDTGMSFATAGEYIRPRSASSVMVTLIFTMNSLLGFQLHPLPNMASPGRGIQAARRFRLVCGLEHVRLGVLLLPFAGN